VATVTGLPDEGYNIYTSLHRGHAGLLQAAQRVKESLVDSDTVRFCE
jgi:hypothetical protein